MEVLKFGGSCLTDKEDLAKTIRIVRSTKRPVLVLSALKGVTDLLIQKINEALAGKVEIGDIEMKHYSALGNLKKPQDVIERLDAHFSEIKNTLTGIRYLGEVTPSIHDKIVSFGERLSVEIMAAYLNEAGINAKAFSDIGSYIITDNNYKDATILDESKPLIRKKVLGFDGVPVIPGFVGVSKEGKITTLGRGGSDYTATYVAAALKCGVTLYKDVDGLMTADPKLVENARIVEKIHYNDALEIAHYGSKVIYEKAIAPAVEANIPILIKNFHGHGKGTMICNDETDTLVVSAVKNAAMIDMFGYSEKMMAEFATMIAGFGRLNIYPLLLVESSSFGEISIVVDSKHLEKVERIIKDTNGKRNIEIKKDVGVVSVIGSAMKGKVGTAARVFDALAEEKINVIGISQSASERNISVVIENKDVPSAVKKLHKVFIERGLKKK
ncbi:MAG: aspartate kinase [Candidatus Micrarchaeia archaeon]